jgi:predicted NodU family carbamoyl transferase
MKNLVKYFLDNHEFIVEINKMIKQRDFWMPFAESMRLEGAKDIGYHG